MIFTPATIDDLVSAARAQPCGKAKPENWHDEQIEEVQKYRDAVEGGEKCKNLLIQNLDEDPQITALRNNLYQNIPICESIIDEQAHWVYGMPPERCLTIRGLDGEDPANLALRDAFSKSCEVNGVDNLWRNELAPAAFRDRWSWMKTWDQRATSLTRMTRLLREEVVPVFDPNDRKTFVGVVEVRKFGDKVTRWGYTTKQVVQLKDDWTPMEAPMKNALGRVPYTLIGSMESDVPHQLSDAYYDQTVAINRRNWYLCGVRMQAFAIFAIIGTLINKDQPSKADGVKRTRLGLGQMLMIAGGGDFKAVNPNFAAGELREAEQSALREAFDLAKVSPEIADSSRAAEQPTTVRIRKSRVLADRQRNIRLMIPAEKQWMTDWLVISAKTRRISANPDDVEIRVAFPKDEDVLPLDPTQARTVGMQEVEKDLRTVEDYVRTYILENAPEEKVNEYLAELEAAKAVKQQLNQSVFGGLAGAINTATGAPGRPMSPAERVYGAGAITPTIPAAEPGTSTSIQ